MVVTWTDFDHRSLRTMVKFKQSETAVSSSVTVRLRPVVPPGRAAVDVSCCGQAFSM